MSSEQSLVGLHVIVSAADTSTIAKGEIIRAYKDGVYTFIDVSHNETFSLCLPDIAIGNIGWRAVMGETHDHLDRNRILGDRNFHFYKPKAI